MECASCETSWEIVVVSRFSINHMGRMTALV